MKATVLAALPVMLSLAIPVAGNAATPEPAASKVGKSRQQSIAWQSADATPKARIRGAQGAAGMVPLEFARWLRAHPDIAVETSAIRRISAQTRLLNRVAISFSTADRDGDGRISADELADFIQPAGSIPVSRAKPAI